MVLSFPDLPSIQTSDGMAMLNQLCISLSAFSADTADMGDSFERIHAVSRQIMNHFLPIEVHRAENLKPFFMPRLLQHVFPEIFCLKRDSEFL